jgi:hypothetical protein
MEHLDTEDRLLDLVCPALKGCVHQKREEPPKPRRAPEFAALAHSLQCVADQAVSRIGIERPPAGGVQFLDSARRKLIATIRSP